MRDIIQSPCPLCDAPAQYEEHDHKQMRYYKCSTCHYYAISTFAVSHLKKHPESIPALAEAVAKMPYETEILEIATNQSQGLNLARVARSKYYK